MSDSEEETSEKQLKIVIVGDSCVGKTNIIRRFCFEEFSRQYVQTVGADFYIRRIMLPGKKEVALRITDVSGSELRGHMLYNYVFNCNLIVLVYDITNYQSFEKLPVWIETLSTLMDKSAVCAVLGNKIDLEHKRAVRLDKTGQFIKQTKLAHYLVSAKTGETINSSFMDLVARHLGIPLSKVEKERQAPVVKAELIHPSSETVTATALNHNTSICSLQ